MPTLSQDKILFIAVRRGIFSVSWRWRDDGLRRNCFQLVKKGLLRHPRQAPGSDWFYPTEKGKQALKKAIDLTK